jgi:hypothetical protein
MFNWKASTCYTRCTGAHGELSTSLPSDVTQATETGDRSPEGVAVVISSR